MWQALQGGDDTAGGSHDQQSSHRATARYEGEECTHSGLGMSGFHDDFLVSPLNKKKSSLQMHSWWVKVCFLRECFSHYNCVTKGIFKKTLF